MPALALGFNVDRPRLAFAYPTVASTVSLVRIVRYHVCTFELAMIDFLITFDMLAF